MSFSWKILAASAAVAALLSGCSSVSLDESAKDGTLAGQTAGSQTQAVNPFADPNNPLSKRSVYFSFDSYEVEAQYMPAVEAHARWLAAHPNVNIIIQGNTDERAAASTTSPSVRSVPKPSSSACSSSASPPSASKPFPSAVKSRWPTVTARKPGPRTAAPTSSIRRK